MDLQLPCVAKRRAGSQLGSTLSTFQSGNMIIEDARIAFASAKLTISKLAPLSTLIDNLIATLQALSNGVSSCDEKVFSSLVALAEKFGKFFNCEFGRV